MKKLYSLVSLFLLSVLIVRADNPRFVTESEKRLAFQNRFNAARYQTMAQPDYNIEDEHNSDESDMPDYVAQFHKCLEHDATNCILTEAGKASYEQFVKAMKSGKQADFNAVVRTPGAIRKFINPQAGLAWTMEGRDSSLTTMINPPTLSSAWEAAEMMECYLMMIARDVAFKDYGTGLNTDNDGNGGSITNNAITVLNSLPAYHGPKTGGVVTVQSLFRGMTAGDQVGPYVSQFLLQPQYPLFISGCAPFVAGAIGVGNLDQDVLLIEQLRPIAQKREFGVSWSDFVAIQNGFIPKVYTMNDYDQSNKRYPINGRDMGSYVHYDGPYHPYYEALNVIAWSGCPISPVFPYRTPGAITNETPGLQMATPDAYGMLGEVAIQAFRAAWAHKYRAHMRLRPEVYAGLVHRAKETGTNPYNLHPSIFAVYSGVDVLELVKEHNALQASAAYDPQQLLNLAQAQTYLLAQMYPEGSPDHPAYPSGHATGAGACTTVLKAIFDDQFLIKNAFKPVKPDPNDSTKLVELSGEGEDQMTLGGELDKLASNVAHARMFAGVHWRSDGDEGMALGEQVAICYLQDHQRVYPEAGFNGYVLTKRDGTRIRITPDEVIVL